MKRQTFASSFINACIGVRTLFLTERNFRIDVFFALLAAFFCILTRTRGTELLAIVLCCALVLGLEGINSAIESCVDLSTSDIHPLAKNSKDMAAGAALIGAVGSLGVGCAVFVPKLLLLLFGTLRVTDGQMPLLALSFASMIAYTAWLCVHPLPQYINEQNGEVK